MKGLIAAVAPLLFVLSLLPGADGLRSPLRARQNVTAAVGDLALRPKARSKRTIDVGVAGNVEDRADRVRTLKVECMESFPASERWVVMCPQSCPYIRFDPTRMCHWRCVTEERCLHTPDMPPSIADDETGMCIVCQVPGCKQCAAHHRSCAICNPGFDFKEGRCLPKSRTIWHCVYVILACLVLFALWYLLCLAWRPVRNPQHLEAAMEYRSQCKTRRWGDSHDFYPFTTNLARELTDSGGVGVLLHFRFQSTLLCWCLLATIIVGVPAAWHRKFRAADVLEMAPAHEELLTACSNIDKSEELAMEALRIDFLYATGLLYLVTTLGCLWFAVSQRRRYHTEEAEAVTMMDFALCCEGFPRDSWDSSIDSGGLEEEILTFFKETWGEGYVVGISVVWNLDRHGAAVSKALTRSLRHLDEEKKEVARGPVVSSVEEEEEEEDEAPQYISESAFADDEDPPRRSSVDSTAAGQAVAAASSAEGAFPRPRASLQAEERERRESEQLEEEERQQQEAQPQDAPRVEQPPLQQSPAEEQPSRKVSFQAEEPAPPTETVAPAPPAQQEQRASSSGVRFEEGPPEPERPSVVSFEDAPAERSSTLSAASVDRPSSVGFLDANAGNGGESSDAEAKPTPGNEVPTPQCPRFTLEFLDRIVWGAMAEEEELGEPGTVCSSMQEMCSTGTVFVVLRSEYDRTMLCDQALPKFRGEHEISVRHMDWEPETVLWDGFTTSASERRIKVIWGIGGVCVTIAIWCVCFYGPFAWYILSWSGVPGMSQGGVTEGFLLGLMVTLGNVVVRGQCYVVAERAKCRDRDTRDMLHVVLYTFSVLVNTIVDLWLVTIMAHGWQQDSGVDTQAMVRNPGVQHALFVQLTAYIYPSTIIVPFLLEPVIAVLAPYYLSKWLVRSYPSMNRWKAEQAMACPQFDLARYGDLIINVVLILLLFFLTSVNMWWACLILLNSCMVIYFWDHSRFLRNSTRTYFACLRMDRCCQYMCILPCAVLASVFAFKLQGGQAMVRSWGKHGFLMYHKEWIVCLLVFLAHGVLHFLALRTIVPRFAVPMREVLSVPYEQAAKKISCNWFNANPVNCLRSMHVFQHQPPHVFFVPGKEYLQRKNTAIHAYYECQTYGRERSAISDVADYMRKSFAAVRVTLAGGSEQGGSLLRGSAPGKLG